MQGYSFDEEAFFRDSKARLRFPFSHLVQPVLDGYDRLLLEPMETLKRWEFDVDQMEKPSRKYDPDDGLVMRRGEKNADPKLPAYDHKTFFHFSSRLRSMLLMRGVDIATHEPFLEACERLHRACMLGMLMVAQAIDRKAGTTTAVSYVLTTNHKLRILRYKAEAEGKVIGKEHTDRSSFTIHLAETFPACYVEDELIEAKEDDALVFASDGIDRDLGGAIAGLHACKHKIVVPPGSRWTSEERRSIVFFARMDR